MTTIRPEELDEWLSSEEPPFLLDIRPRSAYKTSAIDGSYNIPVYDQLGNGEETALRERLDEIPGDRTVVVICKMGVVAKRATKVLRSDGYDAVTLVGGMRGWRGYQNGSLGYKLRSAVRHVVDAL
ncbi:MAG: rhodanese-like domain-containing protein [Halodesulfurarchaeum sp.]